MGVARTPRQQQQPYTHENTASVAPELDSFSAYGNGAASVGQTTSETPYLDAATSEGGECFSENPTWASGEDPTLTSDALAARELPSSKGEALRKHDVFVEKVRNVMRSALAQEIDEGQDDTSRLVLLRNSAEVIESGRMALRVLTPTHDSHQRSPPPNRLAYFDERCSYDEDGATYAAGDPSGVAFEFPEYGHFSESKNEMILAEPYGERTEASIVGTLIHEMQHALDGGPGKAWNEEPPLPQGPYDAPQWVYEYFASEYRARIADPENTFGDPNQGSPQRIRLTATRDPQDPDVQSGRLALQQTADVTLATEQQQRIFDHLLQDTSIQRWYDFQSQQWLAINGYFAHHCVLDPAFRAFVERYGERLTPSGGNLVNSVRIAILSDKIDAGAPGVAIQAAALALDDIDRNFLRDTTVSRPFWEFAVERLLPSRSRVYTVLQSIVQTDRAPDLGVEEYIVVAGDTLGLIAERVLGDRTRWREIAAANPSINPDRLEPGDVLVLP